MIQVTINFEGKTWIVYVEDEETAKTLHLMTRISGGSCYYTKEFYDEDFVPPWFTE